MTHPLSRTRNLRPDLALTIDEYGSGRPALVLHGGGGPATVTGLAGHLAGSRHVLLPTHPGWNGTARPAWLGDVPALAGLYLDLLEAEGHRDVVVVGSSLGGWVAAEMAARDRAGLVGGLVVIDTVGILVEDHPMVDFFALDPRGVAEHSYHDPERFSIDPASLTDAQRAQRAANMATLRALAGDPYMHDPALAGRLGRITAPTLVVWGEADRIATPDYGRVFAAAIPGAGFELIRRAGHLPQVEQPEATFAVLDRFLAAAEGAGTAAAAATTAAAATVAAGVDDGTH